MGCFGRAEGLELREQSDCSLKGKAYSSLGS